MSDDAVVVERRGPVTVLRLNEPHTLNALSVRMKAGLEEAVPAFFADPSARCLIVTGTGDAFCAGGDLKGMLSDTRPVAMRERMAKSYGWVRPLLEAEKPVIMAINGVAAGGGFSLALLGDIIVADEEAYFKPAFSRLGVVPDLGIMYTLPRAVGLARAKDILLTNRTVRAPEALAMGLVTRLAPRAAVLDEAMRIAEQIAAGPGVSLGLTRLLLQRSLNTFPAQFLESEALAQVAAFGTEDLLEGVNAFLTKRVPVFKGS